MVSDRPHDGEENSDFNYNNELEKMLREFLAGASPAQGSGMPFDPQSIQQIFSLFQTSMDSAGSGDSIDWSVSRKTAIEVASSGSKPDAMPDPSRTFTTASLWLDEATEIGSPADAPRILSPVEWVQNSIDTWAKLTEPVADSIAEVLTSTFEQQAPDSIQEQLTGISSLIRKMGGAMFAVQLGQIVGKLSHEVLSGGDIGIPLITKDGWQGGVLIPQNIPSFMEGLNQSETEVLLFLSVRELAHARLFKNAKWLSSHVVSIIREYASGIEIDLEHFQDLSIGLDPSDTEAMQELLRNGSLIPPKTPRQQSAHERLETLIALVDGWVDVVTTDATSRIPGASAIAEMMRRRRATGGPSENAFATLIGLEMRPRKLREAANMWRVVGEKCGIKLRDSIWDHPDLIPSAEEIADPNLLIQRIMPCEDGQNSDDDEFERELAKLLDDPDNQQNRPNDGDLPD